MRIAIIGAGWLGLPLAQDLANGGHTVFASKQTEEGAISITTPHLFGFACPLPETYDASFASQLAMQLKEWNIEAVVGAFPPGFRRNQGSNYQFQWQTLVKACVEAKISKLVMVSATSVYPSGEGVMREEQASLTLAQTETEFSDKAKILLQAEQHVIDSGIKFAIIRASGLYGSDRHPSRFVAKLSSISEKAPANMLHKLDAIGVCHWALENIDNRVVNATSPSTTNKAEFYRQALISRNIDQALPEVNQTPDKTISSDLLLSLGYEFKIEHTVDGFYL
ncbi:NAD-dependent epimerase/dehydratase family protein [Vibrio sp. SCSIO 43136]|uniref:NAD(P)H-binding protein n=1 Tax=Vibrio sp. SCSIO 43136 TaxID=2819101 RepID=UPI0020756A89|nr:NAD-dependent epimerase/dehydratase family protein [Vibrio sp. SCSIO 43136]USD66275.1 NAD(P)H-binding protein [Vibrio sp. SCSIO 43136]